jgi:16S rRNA A1518/A1519 N6-dimethyltransferase RsmA/KsgA/DIM1 with predicted DNA glycosylase/AP lyase activity
MNICKKISLSGSAVVVLSRRRKPNSNMGNLDRLPDVKPKRTAQLFSLVFEQRRKCMVRNISPGLGANIRI